MSYNVESRGPIDPVIQGNDPGQREDSRTERDLYPLHLGVLRYLVPFLMDRSLSTHLSEWVHQCTGTSLKKPPHLQDDGGKVYG